MSFISTGTERLYYREIGTGKRILLAFHGYGEDSGSFVLFEKYLGDEYTILAFDLPHHGGSKWTKDKPLTAQDLSGLLREVKAKYNVDKVSLLGYSLGGRICMAIMEATPTSIDTLTLVASDGMEINTYYYFFTRTVIGKKLFRHLLFHPGLYFSMLNLLKRTKLLDTARHKFITQSLRSHQSRMFLLQVWPALSSFITPPSKIKEIINQYRIPVFIFMGAYDKVIPSSIARKFAGGMRTAKLFILEKGHRLTDNESTEQIAKELI